MQNGGYVNPPPIKRQFRDPHADWWDKQERRNYGEPVHEDHDMLGMFTPHQYTWVSPGKGLVQIGMFVATFLGLCYVVNSTYPDRPSYPREFDGGLERELGGSGAVRVGARSSVSVHCMRASTNRCVLQARAPSDPEPFQTEEE